ncbi:hypothetical protein [Streptomyces sp. NPDC047061]
MPWLDYGPSCLTTETIPRTGASRAGVPGRPGVAAAIRELLG